MQCRENETENTVKISQGSNQIQKCKEYFKGNLWNSWAKAAWIKTEAKKSIFVLTVNYIVNDIGVIFLNFQVLITYFPVYSFTLKYCKSSLCVDDRKHYQVKKHTFINVFRQEQLRWAVWTPHTLWVIHLLSCENIHLLFCYWDTCWHFEDFKYRIAGLQMCLMLLSSLTLHTKQLCLLANALS